MLSQNEIEKLGIIPTTVGIIPVPLYFISGPKFLLHVGMYYNIVQVFLFPFENDT